MNRSNRRQFLKQTGAGVAGAAAWTGDSWELFAGADNQPEPGMPPHRSLVIPGVHGYADRPSVAAGETISFHLSHTVPCRLTIRRLGLRVDDPASDTPVHEFPEHPPRPQPIHPGSYIHIAQGLQGPLRALTLECWLRPWNLDKWAGLITQHDYPSACGYGLFVSPQGGLVFYLGNGGAYEPSRSMATSPNVLQTERWHHLAATWDGDRCRIWVDGQPAFDKNFHGDVQAGTAALRLGAYGDGEVADHFLDGDLAMPAIYSTALGEETIRRRLEEHGLQPARGNGVLACWPLTEERGDRVADSSQHARHGRIINHATWMIGGPGLDAEVPRFGNYDPTQDANRGHAIRFASDDLYNCRWTVTHRFRVPSDAKSGVYVGRVRYEFEGESCWYHIPFVVKKAPDRERAPILVLASCNTWRAYNAAPFSRPQAGLKKVCGTQGMPNSDGNPPSFSMYRTHAGGQGTYQVGLRMPWPAADPYLLYGGATDYSHLLRAERFAHVWLEQEGYDYDLITDVDLHRQPDILKEYPVFMINGHSEYWSLPMYHGLERFLNQGGQVVCLSGNSLFWRVSFNEEATIMECRKVDAPGNQMPPERRGECWHSQDGLRGGLLRECGYPGWKLIGLETLGWINQNDPEQFGAYRVEQVKHDLFHKPEPVQVREGDWIGQATGGGMPRANGHEIDVRLSTLAVIQEKPAPALAVMPVDPPGMTRLAQGIIPWEKGGAVFDYFMRPVHPEGQPGGDIILWERPDGGEVFNAGSIGSGWVLSVDPEWRRLLRNVLARFGQNAGRPENRSD